MKLLTAGLVLSTVTPSVMVLLVFPAPSVVLKLIVHAPFAAQPSAAYVVFTSYILPPAGVITTLVGAYATTDVTLTSVTLSCKRTLLDDEAILALVDAADTAGLVSSAMMVICTVLFLLPKSSMPVTLSVQVPAHANADAVVFN